MLTGSSQRVRAMSCSFVIKDTDYCELLNISRYTQDTVERRVIAMSCSFIIPDTNYCELLNISGYKQDTVIESYPCHDLSLLKIQTTVSY